MRIPDERDMERPRQRDIIDEAPASDQQRPILDAQTGADHAAHRLYFDMAADAWGMMSLGVA